MKNFCGQCADVFVLAWRGAIPLGFVVRADISSADLACSSFADPPPAAVLQGTFSKYIDFAKSIMNSLPPEDVPTDLRDAHMIFKSCDLLNGFYYELGEEDLRDAMGAVLGQAEVRDKSFAQERDARCLWISSLKPLCRMFGVVLWAGARGGVEHVYVVVTRNTQWLVQKPKGGMIGPITKR